MKRATLRFPLPERLRGRPTDNIVGTGSRLRIGHRTVGTVVDVEREGDEALLITFELAAGDVFVPNTDQHKESA